MTLAVYVMSSEVFGAKNPVPHARLTPELG